MYKYHQVTIDEVREQIRQYAGNFSSPVDSFWEEHILEASYYSISINGTEAGFFGIYQDRVLVLFVMGKQYLNRSQEVFADVIDCYQVEEALVPTCDELLMSLSLDISTDLERQAYFFQDSGVVIPKDRLHSRGTFRQAEPEDVDSILQRTGDFFDKLEERIARREVFIWQEDGLIIGAGLIERGVILEQYASIGMFTHPDHRRRGIGRSILEKLKQWCYTKGYEPIAGCWYYNHKSKLSLESAGFITATRLMRIFFRRQAA